MGMQGILITHRTQCHACFVSIFEVIEKKKSSDLNLSSKAFKKDTWCSIAEKTQMEVSNAM